MRSRASVLVTSVLAVVVSALAPVTSQAATARAATTPAYVVTAFVQPNLTRGQPLPIHGRVSPSARGRYAYIEVRKPGIPVWQTLRAVMIRKGGRYAAVLHPGQPGLWRYRVMKPAGDGYRRGVSPVRKVTVRQWRSLESMLVEFDESAGTTPVPNVSFGGLTFSPGYVQEPAGARFFALKRRCTRVDVWVGADPASATDGDSLAQIKGSIAGSVFVLDQSLASATVHRDGAPVHLVLGPDKVASTVHLELLFDPGAEGDRLLWGRPLAYCSF